MKVMNYPFIFHYDEDEVQYRGSSKSDFRQCFGEVAIVAKMQGHHPELFSPSFKSPSSDSCLRHIPKFAHISSIKRTPARLKIPMKKTPLRPNECHRSVFERILRLFVPEKGSVLVTNAGTMISTAVCLELKLRCVCLEEQLKCFRVWLGTVSYTHLTLPTILLV